MLRINDRCDAAGSLSGGGYVKGQRGLAARFRPEQFDNPPARNPVPAEGQVQR